jgi:hypothetical protein
LVILSGNFCSSGTNLIGRKLKKKKLGGSWPLMWLFLKGTNCLEGGNINPNFLHHIKLNLSVEYKIKKQTNKQTKKTQDLPIQPIISI